MSNYRFEFVCSKRWESLRETGHEGKRFCDHCDKDVHLIDDPSEIEKLVAASKCIMGSVDVLRDARMVLPAVPRVSTHKLCMTRASANRFGDIAEWGPALATYRLLDESAPQLGPEDSAPKVEDITIGSGSEVTLRIQDGRLPEVAARIVEMNDSFFVEPMQRVQVELHRAGEVLPVDGPTLLLFDDVLSLCSVTVTTLLQLRFLLQDHIPAAQSGEDHKSGEDREGRRAIMMGGAPLPPGDLE